MHSARPIRSALLCVLLSSLALFSQPHRPFFTRQDKAFFADPRVVNFVRPGLVLKIVGATVAADGTITVQYTLADPQGLPLDSTGVNTPGPVAASFVASYIPRGAESYIPITSRSATGAVSGTIRQPGADAGGALRATADGHYT